MLQMSPPVRLPVSEADKSSALNEFCAESLPQPVLQPKVIALDEITLTEQIRSSTDPTRDEELSDSVSSLGILQPVIVSHDNERGRYVLIAGHRRYRAACENGLSALPCLVASSGLDPLEMARIQFAENYHRQEMSPMDLARVFREIMSLSGLKQMDLGAYLGVSQATISEHLQLFNLSKAEQQEVADGRLGFKEALRRLRRARHAHRPRMSRHNRRSCNETDYVLPTDGEQENAEHVLRECCWTDVTTGIRFVVLHTAPTVPMENVLWALRRRVSLLERAEKEGGSNGKVH